MLWRNHQKILLISKTSRGPNFINIVFTDTQSFRNKRCLNQGRLSPKHIKKVFLLCRGHTLQGFSSSISFAFLRVKLSKFSRLEQINSDYYDLYLNAIICERAAHLSQFTFSLFVQLLSAFYS